MPLHENTIGAHLPFERGGLVRALRRDERKGGVWMFSRVVPHQGAITAAEPEAAPGEIGAGQTSAARRWGS
ncbi:hypothetical protein GCM10009753_19570 [Streptantibioticus ferralitis]